MEELLRRSRLEAIALDFVVEGFETTSARQLRLRTSLALKAPPVKPLRTPPGNSSFLSVLAYNRLKRSVGRLLRGAPARRDQAPRQEHSRARLQIFQRRTDSLDAPSVRGDERRAAELGLEAALPADICLIDSTWLEAHIHFPIDWALLRDVSVTLLNDSQHRPARAHVLRSGRSRPADESIVPAHDPRASEGTFVPGLGEALELAARQGCSLGQLELPWAVPAVLRDLRETGTPPELSQPSANAGKL